MRIAWRAVVRYRVPDGIVIRLLIVGQTPLPGSTTSGALIETLIRKENITHPDKAYPGAFGLIHFGKGWHGDLHSFIPQSVRLK